MWGLPEMANDRERVIEIFMGVEEIRHRVWERCAQLCENR
jgi:hypothetical protein